MKKILDKFRSSTLYPYTTTADGFTRLRRRRHRTDFGNASYWSIPAVPPGWLSWHRQSGWQNSAGVQDIKAFKPATVPCLVPSPEHGNRTPVAGILVSTSDHRRWQVTLGRSPPKQTQLRFLFVAFLAFIRWGPLVLGSPPTQSLSRTRPGEVRSGRWSAEIVIPLKKLVLSTGISPICFLLFDVPRREISSFFLLLVE